MNKHEYFTVCVPLWRAAMRGDWESAHAIILEQPAILTAAINDRGETLLHNVVLSGHIQFVDNLVSLFKFDSAVALKDKEGNTALCFAAASGFVDISQILIHKYENLQHVRGYEGLAPIHIAALFGQAEMVRVLYRITSFKTLNCSDTELGNIFLAILSAEIFDVALDMLKATPTLAQSRRHDGKTALHLMACKPSSISHENHMNVFQMLADCSLSRLGFVRLFRKAKQGALAHQLVDQLWSVVVKLPHDEITRILISPSRLLFDAAKAGNLEFLVILIRSNPDLLHMSDEKNRSLLHVAALHRHENIFNIIYELGDMKNLIIFYKDRFKNTMLHDVARLPQDDNHLHKAQEAAFHMQRELLWFKAVEEIVPHTFIEAENKLGQKPHDIFMKEHKKLRIEGERWMKETAKAYIIIATLMIATVFFATLLPLPGGLYDLTGKLKLEQKKRFDVFFSADMFGILFALVSIGFFVAIKSSRFAQEDFRTNLPTKLMVGVLGLCASMVCMIKACIVTMILYRDEVPEWTSILIICGAIMTLFTWAWLHFPIWFDTICSTLMSRFLFRRHSKRHLSNKFKSVTLSFSNMLNINLLHLQILCY